LEQTKPYIGPILYVIHAPLPDGVLNYAKEPSMPLQITANKSKVMRALNAAGIRGVPVVYASSTHKDWIKETISSVKHMPRIIWVNDFAAGSPLLLKRKLAKEKVNPTKISCLGSIREDCVPTGAKAMKEAFPSAKVYVIEGASTVFRQVNRHLRKQNVAEMIKVGFLRSKKLGAKHFVG